jgi:beta-glucosidase
LDVINVPADAVEDTVVHALHVPKNTFYKLEECEYYKVFKVDVDGTVEEEQIYPFLLMSVVEGNGFINGQALVKGDHFIVPGGYGKMKLSGKMRIIASTI